MSDRPIYLKVERFDSVNRCEFPNRYKICEETMRLAGQVK